MKRFKTFLVTTFAFCVMVTMTISPAFADAAYDNLDTSGNYGASIEDKAKDPTPLDLAEKLNEDYDETPSVVDDTKDLTPTDVKITDISSTYNTVTVSYSAKNASAYSVRIENASTGEDDDEVGSVDTSKTTCTFKNLSAGVKYVVYVEAKYKDGNKFWSAEEISKEITTQKAEAGDYLIHKNKKEASNAIWKAIKAHKKNYAFYYPLSKEDFPNELYDAALTQKRYGDFVRTTMSYSSDVEYDWKTGEEIVINGKKYMYFTYKFKYQLTKKQEEKVYKWATKKAKSLKGKSKKEKVNAIMRYIDKNGKQYNGKNKAMRTAYGFVKSRKTTCKGDAQIFYLLCRKSGVPARIVKGAAHGTTEGTSHYYNIVKYGKKWYFADAHNNTLLTSIWNVRSFFKAHRLDDYDTLNLPVDKNKPLGWRTARGI